MKATNKYISVKNSYQAEDASIKNAFFEAMCLCKSGTCFNSIIAVIQTYQSDQIGYFRFLGEHHIKALTKSRVTILRGVPFQICSYNQIKNLEMEGCYLIFVSPSNSFKKKINQLDFFACSIIPVNKLSFPFWWPLDSFSN